MIIFKQQQTELDMLRSFIFFKNITVIENNDIIFGNAIFNEEPDLEMFRYKKEEKKIESQKDFDYDIKMQVPKVVIII